MPHHFRSPAPTVPGVVVAAVPIRYLFDGEFRFYLPWFQRAYAWTSTQIAALATGIRETMKADGPVQPYPLGTLILARPPGATETAVVDGHQRLMTLTILLAVLRDLEPDEAEKARLDALIGDPPVAGEERAWRLTALADAMQLLITHVQTADATTLEADRDTSDLSLSEQHILDNRDWLRTELLRLLPDIADRRTFASFLLDSCWVIVHLADDEDEAWRRLRLDEDTRLEFDAENRAKATLLSIIPRHDRQAAADGWARCEKLLAPADIVALLHHLRAVHIGMRRRKRPVEVDIADHFQMRTAGLAFIDGVLVPQARVLRDIGRCDIGNEAARRPLTSLAWLDRGIWSPAALLWQAERGPDDTATGGFYQRLERLMWMLRIAGHDATRQQYRVARILAHLRSRGAPEDCADLDVDRELVDATLATLRSHRFGEKKLAGLILRRVSFAVGEDPGPVDPRHLTIEHLLPKRPARGSDWLHAMRTRERVQSHVNRLGNLTFMNHDHNQEAGNREWRDKRPLLAASRFALSAGLADRDTWDGHAIDERTERLVAALFADWGLPLTRA